MADYLIRIDTESDNWDLYGKYQGWKDYLGVENFGETFIIRGNRDFSEEMDASWYEELKSLTYDIDCVIDSEDESQLESVREEHQLSKGDFEKILDILYNGNNHIYDTEVLILRILYPDRNFVEETICGCMQSEWQNVIYDKDLYEDMNRFEEFYFGEINEVLLYNCNEGREYECSDYITNSGLWTAEKDGNLKEILLDRFELPKDSKVQFEVSDGYMQVKKWKQLNYKEL